MKNPDNLQDLIRKANSSIRRLETRYGKSHWGTRRLQTYLEKKNLDVLTKSGRVSSRKYSEEEQEQLTALLDKFTKSPLTKLRDIKKIENDIKQTMKEKFATEGKIPTNEEIETIYKAMEEQNIQWLSKKLSNPSDVWVFIENAKEMSNNEQDFFDMLKNYGVNASIGDEQDEDRQKLLMIYNKYIK